MSAATCSSLGIGVSLLGMPPPLVGQLAGLHPHWWKPAGKGGQGVRRLVQGVMRLLQPTHVAFVAVLLLVACGDANETTANSSTSTSAAPTCEEPPFAASQWVPFAPCGCTALSPWRDACVSSGGRCLFDSAGSICLPSCALNDPCPEDCGAKNPCQEGCGETKECPNYFGSLTSCDVATFDCVIFCADGYECPLEMMCTNISAGVGTCVHIYDNDFP